MKTIVALSDLHYNSIPERLQAIIRETDYFFFLGDGEAKLDEALFHNEIHAVSGNCDAGIFPREEMLTVEGVNILLTHGDRYDVKTSLLKLKLRAKEENCSVVFYGHTHLAELFTEDGVTFINPGAMYSPLSGTPSYAYAVVNNDKIVAKIVDLV